MQYFSCFRLFFGVLAGSIMTAASAQSPSPATSARQDPTPPEYAHCPSDCAPLSNQPLADAIGEERATLRAQRRAIIARNLPLDDAQAEAFWPLYQEYRAAMNYHFYGMRDSIQQRGEAWLQLGDAEALEIYEDLKCHLSAVRLVRIDYSQRFIDALTPTLGLRFIQIDHRLDMVAMANRVTELPLIGIEEATAFAPPQEPPQE